jgi:hypothetical protein
MSVTGKVQNGVVVLPPGLEVPEGAEVEVTFLSPLPNDPPFLRKALELARPQDWPTDFALNHGHYLKGEPAR